MHNKHIYKTLIYYASGRKALLSIAFIYVFYIMVLSVNAIHGTHFKKDGQKWKQSKDSKTNWVMQKSKNMIIATLK